MIICCHVRFVTLALTLGLISASVHAADIPRLGRLFYTPEERAEMEYRARQQSSASTDVVRFTGRIRRSDGKTTEWVNGQQSTGTSNAAETLKVGQALERHSGEVQDVLKGGRIVVRKAP